MRSDFATESVIAAIPFSEQENRFYNLIFRLYFYYFITTYLVDPPGI